MRSLVVAAVLEGLLWYAVPTGPVRIPAADGASSVLWPLVPCVGAAAAPWFLSGADDALSRTAAVAAPVLRARGLLVVAVLGTIAALPGLWRFDPVVVSRNVLLLTGLAVGTAAVLPPPAAWVPATVVPLVSWLLGTDTVTRHHHPWAVLLAARESTVAWVAAVATVSAGVIAYTGRPQLTSGWWTRAPRPLSG